MTKAFPGLRRVATGLQRILIGLFVVTAAFNGSGCVLTEAVTPPPPRIGGVPAEAQALFAQAVPQCEDPAVVRVGFPQQTARIEAEKGQLKQLIESEKVRWNNRRYYLERELRFYEREVRRTGGSIQYTATAQPASFLKVASDSAFTEQIKRQREREYNERQYRRFYRELNDARSKHQERMGLYLARLDEVDNALIACNELQIALRKAREEKELRKNTVAAPNLIPEIKARTLAPEPLPPEPLHVESVDGWNAVTEEANPLPPTAPSTAAQTEAGAPVTLPSMKRKSLPETMEELLRSPYPNQPAPTDAAEKDGPRKTSVSGAESSQSKPATPAQSIEDLFNMPAPQQAHQEYISR